MIEWPFLESDWLREWLPAQSIKRSMARTKRVITQICTKNDLRKEVELSQQFSKTPRNLGLKSYDFLRDEFDLFGWMR